MDPITSAIIAAISSGLLKSATDTVGQVAVDLYAELKKLLKRKYGNDVSKAVENLEKKPESDARQKMVEEEIVATGADKDSEILKVAQMLMEKLKVRPNIEQSSQTAIGSNIVQADRGGKATLNINKSKKNDHD
jgi:hypothetical protein